VVGVQRAKVEPASRHGQSHNAVGITPSLAALERKLLWTLYVGSVAV
jgi:hypothetical protein